MSTPQKLIRSPHLPLVLVLTLSLLINVYGIWWGLPTLGEGWAPDEITPEAVLTGIKEGFSGGWSTRYPPFHYYVLAVLYSPFLALQSLNVIDVHSPAAYTALFYLGRFLSVLMGTAVVFIIYLCGREIYDKKASVFAALITGLTVPFIYHAKITNLDIPYIFWFALSLLFYIRILKNQRLADYLLFVATAVISVCTKDQAYGLYILTFIAVFISHHLHKKRENKDAGIFGSFTDREVVLTTLLAAALFILLHNILFNLDGFLGHVETITQGGKYVQSIAEPRFEEHRIYGSVEASIPGFVVKFYQYVQSFGFSFGWPMFVLCLLGLGSAFLKARKNITLLWLLIPALSYYVFYISILPFYRVRFALPLCIIFAFFGGKFLSDFLNPSRILYKTKVVVTGAVLIYTFIYSFSINVLMDNDSRYYLEKWVKRNIAPESSIAIVSTRIKHLPIRPEMLESHDIKLIVTENPDSGVLMPAEKLESQYSPAQKESDYIITTDLDLIVIRKYKNRPQYGIFSDLNGEKDGYELALKYRFRPRPNLLDQDGMPACHMQKINPEVKVFKRIEE